MSTNLPDSPDPEINDFLEPTRQLVNSVANACRGRAEDRWAANLVEIKRLMHEAQVLLDKRYQYARISELELESAVGVERSTESISGRWLADQAQKELDAEFSDDFEDDEFSEDDFEEDFGEEDDFRDGEITDG